MEEETISHLFYYCTNVQYIWKPVPAYFTDCLHFSQLKPQIAIFGFYNIDNETFFIQNHILLFSRYIYTIPKNTDIYLFNNFLNNISKIKNLKRRVAVNNWNKYERLRTKAHRIENKVP